MLELQAQHDKLIHSHTHSLTHSFTHSLIHSFTPLELQAQYDKLNSRLQFEQRKEPPQRAHRCRVV